VSDTPGIEQLSLHLETSVDPEVSRWNYKLGQAKRLAQEIAIKLTTFDEKVQKIICSEEGYQSSALWEQLSNKELTKKERIKIKICYLLNRDKALTIAQLYKSLGASIKGEEVMTVRHNCVIWDHICLEGIEALNELEDDQWIESYEVSSIEFIKASGLSNFPLSNLPFALPGFIPKDGYQELHWLPIRFEAGLKLMAVKLLSESWEEKFEDLSQDSLIERFEIDKFSNLEEISDTRQRILQSIVQRQGQPEFRERLLLAYEYRCVITDCDVKEALEAAHIIPYLGTATNHSSNGLILRADLHTLFDLFLFTIEPNSLMVIISPSLKSTYYKDLDGKKVRQSKNGYPNISKSALSYHFDQCQWLKD
jgi:hypothetical protein